LDLTWYFVISLLSLVLILETLETVRLKRSLRALGNTLEASRAENTKLLERIRALESENQALRKRLEDLRALVEEVSKSLGLAPSNPEPVATTGFSAESAGIEDPELRRRVLELRVVNLYKQGVPVKEIVKATGLSRATVYRILKKYRGLGESL